MVDTVITTVGVESGYAAALKAASTAQVVIGASAAWSERGRTASPMSPFATAAGAQAEGDRQLAFAGMPLAADSVIVAGQRRDLDLCCIRLVGRELDYAPGIVGFVIGVEELENGTTRLLVLRKLT